jgi:hypothetical protein
MQPTDVKPNFANGCGGNPATLSRFRNKRSDTDGNVTYARASVRDTLLRGEAPIASHLLYTQAGVLRDNVAGEREQGIAAVLAGEPVAEATVV